MRIGIAWHPASMLVHRPADKRAGKAAARERPEGSPGYRMKEYRLAP